MFSTPSIANKKRGSVGTLTTAESSTLIPTNSLFGSQPAASSTPTNSLFGSQPAASTPTNSLFGPKPTTTTTTTTATATNSFFGPQTSTPSSFGSQPNSLFQNAQNTQLTQNNQQQQQQQGTSYLSLDTCFPDEKVPYFIVTPDRTTRTTVPANFFHGNVTRESYTGATTTATSELNNNNEPLSTSVFNERINTLPNYLSAFDNTSSAATNNKSSNSLSTKKRGLEDEETGSNTLLKKTTGVFSSKGTMPYGFDKNMTREEHQKPPTETLKDVGLQSSTLSAGPLQRRFDTNTEQDAYRTYSNTSLLQQPKKTRVRVFGYDQNNVEQIVKHFSGLGELSKPYICQGNWMIFDYVLHETAVKAIKCNGMNIDQDHLVGVTWDERALEVEYLRYQRISEPADLYKKSSGFMNIFNNPDSDLEKIQRNNNKDQKLFDKLREKLLGW
ncbi:hypothetical protein HPULCUR_003017 [Helicostylum pulchrum]|uniref:RRM Nup35-type domain-containing protein n=1 Tax=Helicostylum pulchrum TaxID=562976 RepID=A0ABP9XS99_9FUNG